MSEAKQDQAKAKKRQLDDRLLAYTDVLSHAKRSKVKEQETEAKEEQKHDFAQWRAIKEFRGMHGVVEEATDLLPDIVNTICQYAVRTDEKGNVFESNDNTNVGILYQEKTGVYSVGELDNFQYELTRGLFDPYISMTKDHQLTLHFDDEKWTGVDLESEDGKSFVLEDIIKSGKIKNKNIKLDLFRSGDYIRARGIARFENTEPNGFFEIGYGERMTFNLKFGPLVADDATSVYYVHGRARDDLGYLGHGFCWLSSYYVHGLADEPTHTKETYYCMPGHRSEILTLEYTSFIYYFRVVNGRVILSPLLRGAHNSRSHLRCIEEIEINATGEMIYTVEYDKDERVSYKAVFESDDDLKLYECEGNEMTIIDDDLLEGQYNLLSTFNSVLKHISYLTFDGQEKMLLRHHSKEELKHLYVSTEHIGLFDICIENGLKYSVYLDLINRIHKYFEDVCVYPEEHMFD